MFHKWEKCSVNERNLTIWCTQQCNYTLIECNINLSNLNSSNQILIENLTNSYLKNLNILKSLLSLKSIHSMFHLHELSSLVGIARVSFDSNSGNLSLG